MSAINKIISVLQNSKAFYTNWYRNQFLGLLLLRTGTGTAPWGTLNCCGCGCCSRCCCPLCCWGNCWGTFCSPSSSRSPGPGGGVVGTSQSSVGGTTHRRDLRSNTSMAGHLWRRGYPPWHCQYRLQDLPRGTFPLASSLHRAENGSRSLLDR